MQGHWSKGVIGETASGGTMRWEVAPNFVEKNTSFKEIDLFDF
jgi:hypothetical protein